MRPFLITLALTLAAGPATGQEPTPSTDEVEEEWYVVSDVFAPVDCTAESARAVSFTNAMSAPLAAGDLDCVSVEGLWESNNFYAGIEGYYAQGQERRAEPSKVRLGVYGWRERTELPQRPTPYRLTGRIGECDLLGGPDVMMVMGYCHYVRGRYLALGQVNSTSGPAERLTGAAQRDRLGSLLELDVASPLHEAAERRAREWLSLLRAGDAEAYARAYRMEYQFALIDDPESEFHSLFRDEGSIFRRLAGEDDPELRIWRIVEAPSHPDDPPADPSDYNVLACFKIGDWTGDRWPVAGIDADNNADRPYACVGLWRYVDQGEIAEGVHADTGGPGLLEPAWPAAEDGQK